MFATARYLAMLVLIDQITRASTPGKKPKPNKLSSPRPERTASERDQERHRADQRHDASPPSEDTGAKRDEPGSSKESCEPHRCDQKRPGRGTRHRPGHDGICCCTFGIRRSDDHDGGHHSGDARYGSGERGPCELCGAGYGGLRSSEDTSDHPREVQEHEAREQHCERADAALPLILVCPVRPRLIRCAVVGRIATACEPPDQKEHREHDAGQGQEPLPRQVGERQSVLHHRASSGGRSASPS